MGHGWTILMPRNEHDPPRPTRRDHPKYRARLEHLYEWLLDGRELKRLQKLAADVKAHPPKRTSRRHAVRNPGWLDLPPAEEPSSEADFFLWA
jgi:hypothetical protein